MLQTLNFPSTTTTTTTTTPTPMPTPTTTPKIPLTSPFPLSLHKSPTYPSLKPSLLIPIPSTPISHPDSFDILDVHGLTLTRTPDRIFQDKILFLDSQGLDPLSTIPASAISTSASLDDLKSVFDHLSSLGFTPPDLRRAISMCPQILTLRLRHTSAVFSFLLREARLPLSSLRHAIRRRPRLLISDVETRLRPTMYFLQSIGIHEIHKHTDLLSSSVEDKYLPKIHFFEKVGFSYKDAVSMFRKFPALFCYSVKENYEPKFNYFVVEMGRDLKELIEFPHYFSFSLERRIKPRHQSCVESGVCFPLSVLLKLKDDKFREQLDVRCNSSLPRKTSPLWSVQQQIDSHVM